MIGHIEFLKFNMLTNTILRISTTMTIPEKITCPVNAVIKIVPMEAKKATKPLSPIHQ